MSADRPTPLNRSDHDETPDTGSVVRVLERRRTQIVGTLKRSRKFLYVIPDDPRIPPDAESAVAALNASPRHGEWIDITEGRAQSSRWSDTVRAWVVYPERATRAPVVVVVS